MKDNRDNKKNSLKKSVRLDELLAEERFDEEDEDSVTDDTLEFLRLDDETIESYQSEPSVSKATPSRYEDEEDEEYEDEEYEDEEYEDDEYEDDEYEDEEYEDDEYEYDDEDGGVIVRFRRFLAEMTTLDMVVAMLGIVVLAGVLITGALYVNARTVEKQVASFASVGEEVQGISVIGEGGLLAVSESAKLSGMINWEEMSGEDQEVQEEVEQDKTIEVVLNLTSIQSDLKIKFVNKATGKLIGGVPFEVEVSNGKKTFGLKDEDKDGIIYQTGIDAGTYEVTVQPFKDDYEEYKLPISASSIKVTDTIAYKKVEVADEVKTEAEVNVAIEDTAKKETVEESVLQNTVEWVESTKTPLNSDENYQEIGKDSIPDPATLSALSVGFVKMVSEGANCICTSKCIPGGNVNADCPVCQDGNEANCQCEEAKPETPPQQGQESDPPAQQEPETSEPTNQQKIESLSLNKSSLNLEKGATDTLVVEGQYSTEASVSWSSDNDGVAGVNGGTVTANGAGTATIKVTATIGDQSRTWECAVTVTESQPEQKEPTDQEKLNNLSLNKTTLSLTQGGTDTLVISGDYASSVSSKTWASADAKIASVDSGGKVTAVGVGTTEITVNIKLGTAEGALKCTVTVAAQTYKIAKMEGSDTIKVGGTGTVSITTEPAGGATSWTISDEKIVKIESSSNTSVTLKGVAVGSAVLTVKCGDASATWGITVINDAAGNTSSKLKDKNGNQIYVKKDGRYVEAVYADYYTAGNFYLQRALYLYTGWQTIDGNVYFYDKNGHYVTGEQVIQGVRYTFGSDGKLSAGSGTMGIDVSKWNGSIDWNAVKNSGVSYVIIRCGYRGSTTGALIEDPMFRSNIKGAKAAGLKVGAYFFTQAVNEVEAVEEASMAVSLVSAYGLNYPIFLDVESSGGRADGISKDTRTAVCKAFCATVQNSGYNAGVYANKTWFTEKINTSSLAGCKIWLAQYASTPTYTATRYDMWQYSSKGKVSGINGNVDMNISYMNY